MSIDPPALLKISMGPRVPSEEVGLFELKIQVDRSQSHSIADELVAFTTQANLAASGLPIRPVRTDFTSHQTFQDIRD